MLLKAGISENKANFYYTDTLETVSGDSIDRKRQTAKNRGGNMARPCSLLVLKIKVKRLTQHQVNA